MFVSEARCGQPGQVQACSLVLPAGTLRQDIVGNWACILPVVAMVQFRVGLGLLLFPRNDRRRYLGNPASHITCCYLDSIAEGCVLPHIEVGGIILGMSWAFLLS